MHKSSISLKKGENIQTLREMQESLLLLQNSYDAVVIIIDKLITSEKFLDKKILDILYTEVNLTNIEIEKLNRLIQRQLLFG